MSDSANKPDSADVPALVARDLSFSYGKSAALRSVSLSVGRGERVALLGPNGAGKSTLFALLTGLYAATGGQIAITGHDLRRQTADALRAMGVVFQQSAIDADLSITQNLKYAAALQGLSRADTRERIADALSELDLEDIAGRRVGSLSGGQRRRVELARALLHRPSLLLLDEPTVGLDIDSRLAFVASVHALVAERGVGVLWATHLLDEVSDVDRLVMLSQGQVRADGAPEPLMREAGVADLPALFAHHCGVAA